ncbi:unnamed protein product [Cuscuta campestris]|uniref:Uncharacterized protein n=1 Tax=Cuscuta campestris TaxID=132261 RepID=A0A484LZ65_9ASTE|nr:unnamed protein product [Cuscuta campestris]
MTFWASVLFIIKVDAYACWNSFLKYNPSLWHLLLDIAFLCTLLVWHCSVRFLRAVFLFSLHYIVFNLHKIKTYIYKSDNCSVCSKLTLWFRNNMRAPNVASREV